jgi:hypothetical protein
MCPAGSMKVAIRIDRDDKLPLGVKTISKCIEAGNLILNPKSKTWEHPTCKCIRAKAPDFLNPTRRHLTKKCSDVGHVYVNEIADDMAMFNQVKNFVVDKYILTHSDHNEASKGSIFKESSWLTRKMIGDGRITTDLTHGAIESVNIEFIDKRDETFYKPGHITFAIDVANRLVEWPTNWNAIVIIFCAGIKEGPVLEDNLKIALSSVAKKVKNMVKWWNTSMVRSRALLGIATFAFNKLGSDLVNPQGDTAKLLYTAFSDVRPLIQGINDFALRQSFLTMSIAAAWTTWTVFRKQGPGLEKSENSIEFSFKIMLISLLMSTLTVWQFGFGIEFSAYISDMLENLDKVYGPEVASWFLSHGDLAFSIICAYEAMALCYGVTTSLPLFMTGPLLSILTAIGMVGAVSLNPLSIPLAFVEVWNSWRDFTHSKEEASLPEIVIKKFTQFIRTRQKNTKENIETIHAGEYTYAKKQLQPMARILNFIGPRPPEFNQIVSNMQIANINSFLLLGYMFESFSKSFREKLKVEEKNGVYATRGAHQRQLDHAKDVSKNETNESISLIKRSSPSAPPSDSDSDSDHKDRLTWLPNFLKRKKSRKASPPPLPKEDDDSDHDVNVWKREDLSNRRGISYPFIPPEKRRKSSNPNNHRPEEYFLVNKLELLPEFRSNTFNIDHLPIQSHLA